jgi:hypothetical protein
MRLAASLPTLAKNAAIAALACAIPAAAAFVSGASSGCVTGHDVPPGDGGLYSLSDGAPILEGDAGPTVACVFNELQTYTCPGQALAAPTWSPQCVNGDTCKTRVNGTTTSAGCTDSISYENVQEIGMTCAAWQADGGTLPVLDSGAPPVCAPGSVASFQPTWHPPRAKASVCSPSQISGYLQCLTDSETAFNPPSCAGWTGTVAASNQTCLTCLSSDATDAQYGPLVLLPPAVTIINLAGCLALAEGKLDGSGCGGAPQADQQCQLAACLPTCPTSTASEVQEEGNCEQLANALPGDAGGGGVCAKYAVAAECAGSIAAGDADAGTAAEVACFGAAGGGTDGQLLAVATAFCGQ